MVLLTGTSEEKLDIVSRQFQLSLPDYNKASRGYELACFVGHGATLPSEKHSVADSLERADQKMYDSKRQAQAFEQTLE